MGGGATSDTRWAYRPLRGIVGCEGAEGSTSDLRSSVETLHCYDQRDIKHVSGPCTAAAVQPAAALKTGV